MSDDIGKVVGGVFGKTVVGSAMGIGKENPSTAVAPEKPLEMPMPNDAAAKAAKRKSIASQIARRGRASTILTRNETLG